MSSCHEKFNATNTNKQTNKQTNKFTSAREAYARSSELRKRQSRWDKARAIHNQQTQERLSLLIKERDGLIQIIKECDLHRKIFLCVITLYVISLRKVIEEKHFIIFFLNSTY